MKAMGLIFFGSPSEHIKKLEEEGHHVHEPPRLMWVPYLILAVATIAIGLAGPFIESYFAHSLGLTATAVSEASTTLAPGAEEQASLIATGGSLLMLAVGGFLGYMIYITGKLKPTSLVGETGFARSIYNFLWNRWYINPVYYKIFVYGTLSTAGAARRWIELGFFDKISGAVAQISINVSQGGQRVDTGAIDATINSIASTGRSISSALRRIQTGIPQEYVTVFALGLFALIVFVLFILL
jgi:NADH-quinone oxidoreductase subunit L